MSITDQQMKQIEIFALNKYMKLDSAHDKDHANRTVKLAEYIARKEGADILVCRLGALLHQYHPEEAIKVDEFLEKLNLEKNLREQIVHCIETVSRSTIKNAKTLEAKVVFDADKLQILGPFGIIRQVAYFIESEKNNFHLAIEKTKKMQIDVYNLLQTQTSKDLAEKPHKMALDFFKIFDKWDMVDF